jgi:hypothetical protein
MDSQAIIADLRVSARLLDCLQLATISAPVPEPEFI